MDNQTTNDPSALDKLRTDIVRLMGEARLAMTAYEAKKLTNQWYFASGQKDALAGLLKCIARMESEAQKADVEKPSTAVPLQRVDGRAGRTETVQTRVWWEVVACGRRYRSDFEDEARELMDLASLRAMHAVLWRVVAVERTETVRTEEPGSPIDDPS